MNSPTLCTDKQHKLGSADFFITKAWEVGKGKGRREYVRNWTEGNGELGQNVYGILDQTNKDADMDQGGDRNSRATWTRPRR